MIQNLYALLERTTPIRLKQIIPQRWRIWLGYQIKVRRGARLTGIPQLEHQLSLPAGTTEKELHDYLADFHIENQASQQTLHAYLEEAFRRFLYTLQIIPNEQGRLLEIGANPYFISLLLHRFRQYEVTCTNYFGPEYPATFRQVLINGHGERIPFDSYNVNVETDPLPFPEHHFDVVLLCEVLEHFTTDPEQVLLNIKRVLKPNGFLILTTPNACRLENIARMLAGQNVFDAYSVHGPYGRHNREYIRDEINQFLTQLGFRLETIFTSDIHQNRAAYYFPPEQFAHLVSHRTADLGEYIFVRAVNEKPTCPQKPAWLYRGYPVGE